MVAILTPARAGCRPSCTPRCSRMGAQSRPWSARVPARSSARVRGGVPLAHCNAKERQRLVESRGHRHEGGHAGRSVLEHVVDTVLSFDGDLRTRLRVCTPEYCRRHRRGQFRRNDRAGAGRRARRVRSRRPSSRRAGSARWLRARGRARPILRVEVQALAMKPRRRPRGRSAAGMVRSVAMLLAGARGCSRRHVPAPAMCRRTGGCITEAVSISPCARSGQLALSLPSRRAAPSRSAAPVLPVVRCARCATRAARFWARPRLPVAR